MEQTSGVSTGSKFSSGGAAIVLKPQNLIFYEV